MAGLGYKKKLKLCVETHFKMTNTDHNIYFGYTQYDLDHMDTVISEQKITISASISLIYSQSCFLNKVYKNISIGNSNKYYSYTYLS